MTLSPVKQENQVSKCLYLGSFINVLAFMFVFSNLLFPGPGWAFFLSALGLFIYQSLDAIDGKQARRTNSSSALGELFDHGCDAVSTGITKLDNLSRLVMSNI